MPVYIVWELRHLDPLGRESLVESRALRIEAEDIKACAEQVRCQKAFIKHGVKEFLIVERGYRIPPGGGPLNFHDTERARAMRAGAEIASDKEKNGPFVKRGENIELDDVC